METLKTFVYYERKTGRRLAIYGEPVNGKLVITVIPCSLQDNFSKKIANSLYEGKKEAGLPQENVIDIVDAKPLHTFLNWVKERYSKKIMLEIDVRSIEVKRTLTKTFVAFLADNSFFEV